VERPHRFVNRFCGRSGVGNVPAHSLAPQNLSSDKHVDVCVDSGEDRGSTPLASSPENFSRLSCRSIGVSNTTCSCLEPPRLVAQEGPSSIIETQRPLAGGQRTHCPPDLSHLLQIWADRLDWHEHNCRTSCCAARIASFGAQRFERLDVCGASSGEKTGKHRRCGQQGARYD
jgi:hypothetical protein